MEAKDIGVALAILGVDVYLMTVIAKAVVTLALVGDVADVFPRRFNVFGVFPEVPPPLFLV